MPNPPIIINNINDLIEYINDNIFQNNDIAKVLIDKEVNIIN